jgi:hypothetical protein
MNNQPNEPTDEWSNRLRAGWEERRGVPGLETSYAGAGLVADRRGTAARGSALPLRLGARGANQAGGDESGGDGANRRREEKRRRVWGANDSGHAALSL